MDELIPEIHQYLVERGWDQLRPTDIAKSVSIEANELLELFQWGSLTIEETKADAERLQKVRGEVADVLIYCLEMCDALDLSPNEIVREKLEHARKKYPVELIQSWKQSTDGGGKAYEEYKREMRGKKNDATSPE